MDPEQQVCVAPDEPGPLASPAPVAAPVSDGAGGAGGAGPVAALAPAGGPSFGDVAAFDNNVGDAMGMVEVLGKLGKVAGDTGALAGKAGGALALPNDVKTAVDGVSKGDYGQAVIGAAGAVGDVATVAGADGVANIAGGVKGVVEVGKGYSDVYDAATAGPIAPGQSGVDPADQMVNGVENLLAGAGDIGAALPGNAGLVGKSFKAGMGAGKLIAPLVFSGDSSQQAPEDGKYYGTTGNSAVDWVAGVGKYSVSRF